ncbi:hypothetical protein QC761_302030 [Podospora bellae-mahoneyi]|uniref:Uncharacterized protein n=1 Tax=Podospora bellae-mahoneyi TaxID=2093777 RepID=A0ABR0FJP9_9PEZI|nr:hypothetical protein QC761_302030 [Podospora bellae-mahoneyi]
MSPYRACYDSSFRPPSPSSGSTDDEDYEAYLQASPYNNRSYVSNKKSVSGGKTTSTTYRSPPLDTYEFERQPYPTPRTQARESPSTSDSDESTPSDPEYDSRRGGYSRDWDSDPPDNRFEEAKRLVFSVLLWVLDTALSVLQYLWELPLRVLRAIRPWALYPLLFALSGVLIYATLRPTIPYIYREIREDLLTSVPYGRTRDKLWASHEPGVFDNMVAFLWGGRAESEKDRGPEYLKMVESLQGGFVATAQICKQVFVESAEMYKSHDSFKELWRLVYNSDWERGKMAGEELWAVWKRMALETKALIGDFQKRIRLFHTKIKEEDLKLVDLAHQLKQLKALRPSEEELAAGKKSISPKILRSRPRGTALPTAKVDNEETKKETVELDELGRRRLRDLVVTNLDRTRSWISAARVDLNILMRELEVLLRGLEKATSIVFHIYPERYYHDRVELAIWNRLLTKARESGLSDKSAEDLKELPKHILSAQECIWLMVTTLGKSSEEIELLTNALTSTTRRLTPRWTVDEVVGVYANISQDLEESADLLGLSTLP